MVGVHFNITESYTPTFDRMIRSGLALPCLACVRLIGDTRPDRLRRAASDPTDACRLSPTLGRARRVANAVAVR